MQVINKRGVIMCIVIFAALMIIFCWINGDIAFRRQMFETFIEHKIASDISLSRGSISSDYIKAICINRMQQYRCVRFREVYVATTNISRDSHNIAAMLFSEQRPGTVIVIKGNGTSTRCLESSITTTGFARVLFEVTN